MKLREAFVLLGWILGLTGAGYIGYNMGSRSTVTHEIKHGKCEISCSPNDGLKSITTEFYCDCNNDTVIRGW